MRNLATGQSWTSLRRRRQSLRFVFSVFLQAMFKCLQRFCGGRYKASTPWKRTANDARDDADLLRSAFGAVRFLPTAVVGTLAYCALVGAESDWSLVQYEGWHCRGDRGERKAVLVRTRRNVTTPSPVGYCGTDWLKGDLLVCEPIVCSRSPCMGWVAVPLRPLLFSFPRGSSGFSHLIWLFCTCRSNLVLHSSKSVTRRSACGTYIPAEPV